MLTKLARLFDLDLSVQHDFSSVEPLQSVRDAQLARIQLHIMNGMRAEDAYAFEGLHDAPIGKMANKEEPSLLDEKSQKTVLRLFENTKKKTLITHQLKEDSSGINTLKEDTNQSRKKSG